LVSGRNNSIKKKVAMEGIERIRHLEKETETGQKKYQIRSKERPKKVKVRQMEVKRATNRSKKRHISDRSKKRHISDKRERNGVLGCSLGMYDLRVIKKHKACITYMLTKNTKHVLLTC